MTRLALVFFLTGVMMQLCIYSFIQHLYTGTVKEIKIKVGTARTKTLYSYSIYNPLTSLNSFLK
jgi:hypothetical protein